MKITLVMVMSTDGKITKWFNPHVHTWTSKEDQNHFANLVAHSNLLIMGRKTYEVAKPTMKHSPEKLRVVITSSPEKFAAESIPGQLEFTNQLPATLIDNLGERMYSSALLVGGSEINTIFLRENLVDEILLTIEPKLLGKGNFLLAETELYRDLQLLSIKQLNDKGTLLLHYKIVK